MDDTFVAIEYNQREFKNALEFRADLDQDYRYQIRPKFIAAAAEGGEIWITIFINSDLKQFLISAVIGGLIWDTIKIGSKKYILKPLFSALAKLNKANSIYGGLKILKLKFQYDDCEVIIGGVNRNFMSAIPFIFSNIHKMKGKFEKEQGVPVIKIELPIEFNPAIDKRGFSPYSLNNFHAHNSIQQYRKLWKITYLTGHPILIYDFEKSQYMDAYPNR